MKKNKILNYYKFNVKKTFKNSNKKSHNIYNKNKKKFKIKKIFLMLKLKIIMKECKDFSK